MVISLSDIAHHTELNSGKDPNFFYMMCFCSTQKDCKSVNTCGSPKGECVYNLD